MGHTRKQLFFGRDAYPSHTCLICNSSEVDTWLHVLLKCKQQHVHALITNKHNKAVWEIHKLLISNKVSRHYILMNAGTYNELSQENTVPTWLLIMHMWHPNMPLQHLVQTRHSMHLRSSIQLPTAISPYTINHHTIHEFTYCNDIFSAGTTKYQPLINNIISRGWNTPPLMVLAAGARAITHIPLMKELETKLKLPTSQIRNTFKQNNLIAIQYAHSILVHKRWLENRQPITYLQDHV